jgi:uncharacterized membrane protein YkoI
MKTSIRYSLLASILFVSSAFGADKPPKNIISIEKAKTIATETAPGDIKSSELEFEGHKWVYSFDIASADAQIHEVLVNAKTGKVVSNTIESPQKEAQESKQE